jgi:hypothetical protein
MASRKRISFSRRDLATHTLEKNGPPIPLFYSKKLLDALALYVEDEYALRELISELINAHLKRLRGRSFGVNAFEMVPKKGVKQFAVIVYRDARGFHLEHQDDMNRSKFDRLSALDASPKAPTRRASHRPLTPRRKR